MIDQLHENIEIFGTVMALSLVHDITTNQKSIHDDAVLMFLPVLFAEGNLEFLKLIADKLYVDTRKEVIHDFINTVEEMTKEGIKKLHED